MLSLINLTSKRLKYFKVIFTSVDNDYTEPIISFDFPNLESLEIIENALPIPIPLLSAFLTHAPNLIDLNIRFCSNLTDNLVFEIFTNHNLKHLKRIKLFGCHRVENDGVIFLTNKKSLTTLVIKYNRNVDVRLIGDRLKEKKEWTIFCSPEILRIEKFKF